MKCAEYSHPSTLYVASALSQHCLVLIPVSHRCAAFVLAFVLAILFASITSGSLSYYRCEASVGRAQIQTHVFVARLVRFARDAKLSQALLPKTDQREWWIILAESFLSLASRCELVSTVQR